MHEYFLLTGGARAKVLNSDCLNTFFTLNKNLFLKSIWMEFLSFPETE